MYQSIHIRNYRGLRDLAVQDLGRVNLFVGANNVGKTSLLEALWLFQGPGNPALTQNIARFRGFDPIPRTAAMLWQWLFREGSADDEIEIKATDREGRRSRLRISLTKASLSRVTPSEERRLEFAFQEAESKAQIPDVLKYEVELDDNPPVSLGATLTGGDLLCETAPALNRATSVFLSSRRWTNAAELATRFTTAADEGKKDLLLASLRVLEPQLEDVSVGVAEGGPLLRGHVGLQRPVPLPLLGGGVVRLTEVLLAALVAKEGLLLIDEMENGLYHRNLEASWCALDVASADATAQVVATTHSWECVQAAVTAFSGEHEADFRLHRLERKGEEVSAVAYDHETAQAAVELNFEVR